jgi:SAM-dependent methyltransferase
MTPRSDQVWQSADVANDFLEGMRGAIPQAAEQIDIMLRLIRAARPHVQNFLDIGCGDGVLGRAILARYPEAQGVFLDFSEPMIAAARTKITDANVSFVVQDYGLPEWVNALQSHAPFDVIVSGFSIHHQPDGRKRELYAEIYDLLKPGGIFINVEHVAPVSSWLEDVFSDVFIDSTVTFNERGGIHKSREEVARDYHDRPHKDANILTPLELQCGWLRELGFQQVDCYLKIFELAVFGGIHPGE